jgi:hypothetical protein
MGAENGNENKIKIKTGPMELHSAMNFNTCISFLNTS